jgi:shikimate dehydrogenase
MSSGFKSELTGCFSIPCDDNPTVAMVEAAYRHHGLPWRYINAEVPPDGLGMLVGQGILGIKYWAGIDADADVMRAALEEVFS